MIWYLPVLQVFAGAIHSPLSHFHKKYNSTTPYHLHGNLKRCDTSLSCKFAGEFAGEQHTSSSHIFNKKKADVTTTFIWNENVKWYDTSRQVCGGAILSSLLQEVYHSNIQTEVYHSNIQTRSHFTFSFHCFISHFHFACSFHVFIAKDSTTTMICKENAVWKCKMKKCHENAKWDRVYSNIQHLYILRLTSNI